MLTSELLRSLSLSITKEVDDAEVLLALLLFFSPIIGRAETVAFCLLGHGSILRAQCADERLDRPGVPSCRNRFLPAADTKSASSVATETVFQHACFFSHLSPVARSGGSAKPRSGANSGVSLVLFH